MGLAERARSQISALTAAATPRLRQGSGVLALAGLAVAGMALLSHDPTDPSFNVAADGQAKNWLGSKQYERILTDKQIKQIENWAKTHKGGK